MQKIEGVVSKQIFNPCFGYVRWASSNVCKRTHALTCLRCERRRLRGSVTQSSGKLNRPLIAKLAAQTKWVLTQKACKVAGERRLIPLAGVRARAGPIERLSSVKIEIRSPTLSSVCAVRCRLRCERIKTARAERTETGSLFVCYSERRARLGRETRAKYRPIRQKSL
jgi:hypothetical protein